MTLSQFIESGLTESYVLGATTAEETQLVERMIATHQEVRAEVESIQRALENYIAKHAIAPDTSLREKVRAKLQTGSSPKMKSNTSLFSFGAEYTTTPVFWRSAAGIALILLVGSVVANVFLFKHLKDSSVALSSLESQQSRLVQQIDQRSNALDSMNKSLAAYKNEHLYAIKELSSLHNPDIIALKADNKSNQQAVVFWCSSTRIVHLDPGNLPENEASKQYQLWAFVKGKPVSVGIFSVNATNKMHMLQRIPEAEGFAITLEQAGGVPSPEGPIVVKANL
jgi:anti-sigma-K factor RskA